MSVERQIMSAIVRADMFLSVAWKYMLVLLMILGIVLLLVLNIDRRLK